VFRREWLLVLALTMLSSWTFAGDAVAQAPLAGDPIAREIALWRAKLSDTTITENFWVSVKPGAAAALDLAEQALKAGRRWMALERLAAARANLVAAQYVGARPAETRKGVPAFEAEWTRMSGVLGAGLKPPAPLSFATIQPAAARALTEAAGFQIKLHYDASIIYGRATDADSGLFYLGSAQANQDFVAFAKTLSAGKGAPQPPVRRLTQETDALEAALLALYRPPVSIDRHSEFIAASSALKEAKELDAAGLRYGALQRYLLAVLRVALLQSTPAQDAAAVRSRLAAIEPRLSASGADHTIAQIFFERALTELDRSDPAPTSISIAAVIADDVLPKYFAALEPAPPVPAASGAPRVTVTLVRWPFT
jgi:hypothetical protein